MPSHRRISRAVYSELDLPRIPRRRRWLALLLPPALLLVFALVCSSFLRRLSGEIAMSNARDAVTLAVSECVRSVMAEKGYGYSDFVTLEKDAEGGVCAITANTAQINLAAAEVLSEMVEAAPNRTLEIRIPLGNLLGSNLLLGRGPEVPVEILMLTSSFVRFDNALESTGINQTRHSLTLKADVDVDILIPWATMSTTVETEVLIAETIIVGRVPQTYVNMEGMYGSD